jgi:hypothetical protein
MGGTGTAIFLKQKSVLPEISAGEIGRTPESYRTVD